MICKEKLAKIRHDFSIQNVRLHGIVKAAKLFFSFREISATVESGFLLMMYCHLGEREWIKE